MNLIERALNKIIREFIIIISPILPINRKRIYVSSFAGRYSDSPKQIANFLKKMHPELEIAYLVKRDCRTLPDCFVRSVSGSWRDAFYRSTALIVIDNNYGKHEVWLKDNTETSKRIFNSKVAKIKNKNQFVYTSWHGTPLKCMGIDTPNSEIIDFECPNTRMFLGNEFTAKIMNHLMFQRVPIDLIGTPRNDPLFVKDVLVENELKKSAGIPINKKVLLYAPTFRDSNGEGSKPNVNKSGLDQIKQIDFSFLQKVLSDKFGGEWVIVLRFHYFVDKQVDWNQLAIESHGSVINGNKLDDMTDYLRITDLLLTDASSCMFDFALTSRPCFLFFPDVDEYSKYRGLYFKFNELPFKVALSFDEFIETIKSFNPDQYENERLNFLNRIGNIDDGRSTIRVCEYIYNRHFGK